MMYFKDKDNMVYAYEDDVDPTYIKPGLTAISEEEALKLAANPPRKREQLINISVAEKTGLYANATLEIAWRQDSVDLNKATDDIKTQLTAWKNTDCNCITSILELHLTLSGHYCHRRRC